MDYKEFNTKVKKANQKKQFKVRGSWGIYQAYKLIRKNGWYDIGRPLKEHEFYSIIRNVNKLFANEIANGNEFTFPCKMGNLEIRKSTRGVYLIDGKLINTYPIDWNSTLKLWYEDEESRRNKTKLRYENKYVYSIKYNKFHATFENKSFYAFDTNRFLKIALQENVKQGKIDTLYDTKRTIYKHKKGA